MTRIPATATDARVTVQRLKLVGLVLVEASLAKIHVLNEHQGYIKTIPIILRLVLQGEETEKKRELRNVMTVIHLMGMAAKEIVQL